VALRALLRTRWVSVDLEDAAKGRISATDCDISGVFAAASFVREYALIIERF
jgi:hypothetical protein